MGQIRKLDKEGMRSRVDKKNLSGSSWTCFKMADQTLTEIDGIVSNCSVGGITIPRYESLADSIGKLEADSKLLLDYPDELIEGIDTVDSDFSHNVNNALNALSAIKLDDIRVKNTFDVEVTSVFNTHDHTGDPLNSPKPDLTIADFIGYFDEYALGRDTSFVKGFTDVLYLEDIREGKSLQEILKEDNDTLKELLYGSEIDIKKYAPNAQYMSEIAGDIPGGIYPLATAIYGYDIFTHDRLTKKERKNEGITGTVELVLLLLLWGKADGLVEGVTPYLSMAGSNVAQTGAEHLCEDMGAPPLATLLISSTVGALAFVGGEAAGMKSAEIINSQRGVFKGVDKNAAFPKAKDTVEETSHGKSSGNSAKPKGWKVGDPIDNLTKAGNEPSWSTVKARYWKNKAYYYADDYLESDLIRMQKGLAPKHPKYNVSMELHHIGGRNITNPHNIENLQEVWPWEHDLIDEFRYYTGPKPEGY